MRCFLFSEFVLRDVYKLFLAFIRKKKHLYFCHVPVDQNVFDGTMVLNLGKIKAKNPKPGTTFLDQLLF